MQLAHFAPIGAHAVDDVGSGGHKGPEALFTFAQRSFDALLIGDIDADAHQPRGGALGIAQGPAASFYPADFACVVAVNAELRSHLSLFESGGEIGEDSLAVFREDGFRPMAYIDFASIGGSSKK